MRENNRKPIEKCRKKLPQFTTMNVIDGQAGLISYFSLIFYSLTIDNILNIIVLIILAGVSIAMLVGENGIITQAQKAKAETEEAERKEKSDLDYMEQYVDRIINGNKGLNTITGEETTNSIVYDKYGNKVVVPAGFKIINPEDDVTKGIVIEDVNAGDEYTKGSQFVWIPIGNVYMDENGSYKTITFGRYSFDAAYSDEEQTVIGSGEAVLVQKAEDYADETVSTSGIVALPEYARYKECLKTTETENVKAKDLESFIKKAIESKGYYIGRYEAGDYSAIDTQRTGTEGVSYPNSKVTCKSGVYPYTFVNQSDASMLSQTMYTSNKFDSDLINSFAWNTALIFIQTFSGDENYAKQTRLQDSIAKCGEATDGINKDVRCNIYDMAGNVQEFTTETCINKGTNTCVLLGPNYWDIRYFCANRNYRASLASREIISFRVVLYL